MNIEELEKFLSEHPFLPKPKYVFMVEERVVAELGNLLIIFKGVTPKDLRDRIALTPDANDVTVVHELLHLAGLDEIGAYLLAPRIRKFREIFPPILKSEVKYREIDRPHPKVRVFERI
jgi:hypothetical protein